MKLKFFAFISVWLVSAPWVSACGTSAVPEGAITTSPDSSLTPIATIPLAAPTATSGRAQTVTPVSKVADCPGGRLVFEKTSGGIGTREVYIYCVETGIISFAFGGRQYPNFGGSSDISPDRESILFITDEVLDKIVSFDLNDQSFSTIVEHTNGQQIDSARWSPDGNFVGYVVHSTAPIDVRESDHLEFVHVATHTVSKIYTPFSSDFLLHLLYFRWSANSHRVMFLSLGPIGTQANGLFDMTVECDNQTHFCHGTEGRSFRNIGVETALSSDGLLSVGYGEDDTHPRGYIIIGDKYDNTVRRITLHDLDPDLGFMFDLMFSPDASQVAFGARQLSTSITGIYILNLANMTLRNLTQGFYPGAEFTPVAWR